MNSDFMQAALDLGANNTDGGPFGAVIVKDGVIIGRGHNQVIERHDPTAHAEIQAIREASHFLQSPHLQDCQIYTSCEPCPMCLGAIYWAQITHIYYAASRADAADIGFLDAEIYTEVSKPLGQRRIPLKQCMHQEAKRMMTTWQNLSTAHLY